MKRCHRELLQLDIDENIDNSEQAGKAAQSPAKSSNTAASQASAALQK